MTTIDSFVSRFPIKSFQKDEMIIMQDTVPTRAFAIKNGFVKGYDINIEGAEQLVWFGAEGDFFPLPWIFSISRSTKFFYSAFSDAEVYVIPRGEFISFLKTQPEALFSMTRRIVARYYDQMRRLNASGKPKADQKLTHLLHFLAMRFGYSNKHKDLEINIPLTQQDIANLLGITRETTAIELRKLKEAGFIDYEKSLILVRKSKIEEIL